VQLVLDRVEAPRDAVDDQRRGGSQAQGGLKAGAGWRDGCRR
jgi:hypothetical protein